MDAGFGTFSQCNTVGAMSPKTPLLKRMELAGLLQRTRSAEDERKVLITATSAGRKLKARAAKVPACVLRASGCTVPEVVTLTKQVRALRARLAP